jgi:hypothetical protein
VEFFILGKRNKLQLFKGHFLKHCQICQPLPKSKADIAWFLYDLEFNQESNKFDLVLSETVYSEFEPALLRVTTPEPGDISSFIDILQTRLDEHLDKNPPDAPSLSDIISS